MTRISRAMGGEFEFYENKAGTNKNKKSASHNVLCIFFNTNLFPILNILKSD